MNNTNELKAKLKAAAPYEMKFSRLWERYDEACHGNAEHMRDILELTLDALETAERRIANSDRDVRPLTEALEAAEQNNDGVSGLVESYETTISMLKNRIAELEAQIAELAAQEPVGWMTDVEIDELHRGIADEAYIYRYVDSTSIIPLYTRAAPPAPLTVKLPQGYTVRAGHPINEGERGVMIPKEGGDWLHRFDVEHALLVAGFSRKIEGE